MRPDREVVRSGVIEGSSRIDASCSGLTAVKQAYLVVPWSPTQHLCTLETGGHTLCGELSAFWEECHVDALTQVDQSESMIKVLRLKRGMVQEPERQAKQRFQQTMVAIEMTNPPAAKAKTHTRAVHFRHGNSDS